MKHDLFTQSMIQPVRILDVFVVGPSMIYGGQKLGKSPMGRLLTGLGIATIVYNGANFLRIARGGKSHD